MRFFLITLAVLLSLLLTSCSAGKKQPDLAFQSLHNQQVLKNRYGFVEIPEMSKYLHQLAYRLGTGISQQAFVFLKTEELIVVSDDAHYYFSLGFFREVKDEETVAFVLAHEYAHFALGHPFMDTHDRKRYELEADLYATQVLCRARFSLSAPLKALLLLQRFENHSQAQDYPTIHERRSEISKVLFSCPFYLRQTDDRKYLRAREKVFLRIAR